MSETSDIIISVAIPYVEYIKEIITYYAPEEE